MAETNWLQGRHALITGGGTGIGASIATHLHAAGARISVLGRRLDPLADIASTTQGTAVQCDVTDRDAIARAFGEARAANGPIAFLVVNAGVGDSAPFGRTTRESWDRIIATNLTSAFDCAQAALDDLTSQEDGRMVFVASVAGLKGAAYAAPYSASKHGMVGLMRSLAAEFARTSMTVNAVCPSFVDTPMVDDSAARIAGATGKSVDEARQILARANGNGRLITVEEVTHAIMQLLHPAASGTNGACVTIDGGTSA